MAQVDAPCLAMGRHTRFDGLTDTEFLDVIFKTNLLALNRALSNIPASRIRVHICWGNYPGPHTKDIGAELLWPHLVNLKARYILIEMANPRHGADLTALASVASKLGDKVIVPGVVECTNPRVEHPRLIAERLVQLAALVGPVHVMAGTDCGFASTANALAITEDIVWMKIRAMVEGAKIASELLYNANAPATTSLLSNHATARVVLCGDAATWDSMVALRKQLSEHRMVAHTHLVDVDEPDAALEAVQWRIDWPIMAVALCQAALPVVRQILNFINSSGPKNAGNSAVSRRSATHVQVRPPCCYCEPPKPAGALVTDCLTCFAAAGVGGHEQQPQGPGWPDLRRYSPKLRIRQAQNGCERTATASRHSPRPRRRGCCWSRTSRVVRGDPHRPVRHVGGSVGEASRCWWDLEHVCQQHLPGRVSGHLP